MKAILIAILLSLGFAAPAQAQTTVRHPATGSPAITVTLPSTWTQQVDSDGNLIISSNPRGAAYSITVGEDSSPLDKLAAAALGFAQAAAPTPSGPATLSPFSGSRYRSTMVTNGVTLNLTMDIVKPDATRFVSVTLVALPGASAAALAEADTVLSSLRVVN